MSSIAFANLHLSLSPTMTRLAVCLLLSACGQTPTPNPNPNPQPGACANTINQDLTIATIWRNGPAECDYLVMGKGDQGRGSISVSNGMLTIEPGTVVRFVQDTALDFRDGGGLSAVGTAQNRIRFEGASPVKGFGRGLFFGPQSLLSRMENAELRYLGKRDTGAFKFHNAAISGLQNTGLVLKNTTISGSVHIGLEMDNLIISEFANNVFRDNTSYGVYTSARQIPLLDTASDYLGQGAPNGRPFLALSGLFSDETVVESATWRKLNAPYFVDSALYIEGGTLTLEPGVEMVMNQGAAIKIEGPGALTAIGTAQAPIRFVGEQPQKGYWDEIYFYQTTSPANRLEHVQIRHGGGGTIYEASVVLPLKAKLFMANTLVSDSSTWGICVGLNSELTQGSGNTFSGNVLGNVGDDEVDECG